MESHIKFAAALGFLTSRAKFAAENPEAENKYKFWSALPLNAKQLLLGVADQDRISGYTNATATKSTEA